VLHETVFHRVEIRVVHVSRKVPIVAYRVLPIPPSPNAPFAAAGHRRRSRLAGRQTPDKCGFDCAPPTGAVGIALPQIPQAMHMIGKDNPGVDAEGRTGAHPANRIAQIRRAVAQVHCKEEGSARNPIAAIIRHTGSMPELSERRKALRFSALRLLLFTWMTGIKFR
jgi:hypothetical protein